MRLYGALVEPGGTATAWDHGLYELTSYLAIMGA